MKTLSVIVPIYGVEKYIEKCVRSLFEQTNENLEFVFVNDCTKDRSVEILQSVLLEYPKRVPNTIILNNETNLGQSGARKRGILAAHGDYMIHCDPDDWVDLDFYEKIAKKAEETDADIICCDYRSEFSDGGIKDFIYEDYNHPHDKIRSKKQNMWSLCLTCVKTTLIRNYNILPPDNINMTEDMNMLMRIHFFASTIANVHGTMYHYLCQRDSSITNSATKSKELMMVQAKSLQQIDSFYKEHNFDAGDGLMILKRSARDCFLRIGEYQCWYSTFPESVPFALSDNSLSTLYRVVYSLGSKGLLLPIRFYHWLSSVKKII